MEVAAPPPTPTPLPPVDLNLLRYQMNTGEFSYLQKVVDTTPSTTSVKYPGLDRQSEQAAVSALPSTGPVPHLPIPPQQQPMVAAVMPPVAAPETTYDAPPSTPSKLDRITEKIASVLFQAGHNPDPVEPATPQPVYVPKPAPAVTQPKPPAQYYSSAATFSSASTNPTYGQRPPVSTFAGTATPMPSAPPESPMERYISQTSIPAVNPSPFFSLLQEVSNRTPVERLQRFNCNANNVQRAGMSLSNFYEAGYTLREVVPLFPTFGEMLSIGVNKHFFTSNRWNIREFSQIYQVPMRNLIATNCFAMTPGDLVACGLGSTDFAQLGISVQLLQDAGADFMFWNQLRCSPVQFAALGGTVEHVVGMNLTQQQRGVLELIGWNFLSIQKIPGVSASQAIKLWPTGFKMK